MNQITELHGILARILAELKIAVDLSIQIHRQSPQAKKEVTFLWEKFLAAFLSYIKQKGKAAGVSLLDGLSWMRLSRM